MLRTLTIFNNCILGCALVLIIDGPLDSANAKSGETVLYSFTGGKDGGSPTSPLIMDASGNLYGTTYGGGNPSCSPEGGGCGTAFEVTTGGTEKVLYKFCSQPDCVDGDQPYLAGLITDAAGNLYGTTQIGGAANLALCLRSPRKATKPYSFTLTEAMAAAPILR